MSKKKVAALSSRGFLVYKKEVAAKREDIHKNRAINKKEKIQNIDSSKNIYKKEKIRARKIKRENCINIYISKNI